MHKGMEEIMMAMGGQDGGSESAMPKPMSNKRKVYVDEAVYNRLMDAGEATDAEPDLNEAVEDYKTREPSTDPMAKLDAGNPEENDDIMASGEMPEGIPLDDDEDDSMLKKMGRLFGNNISGIKAKMKRG